MKKLMVTVLALIYLSTSMGASVHLHYCMGKLVAWGFVDHDSKDCRFCGMSKLPKGESNKVSMQHCCHDEHKHIQNDKDQKATQTSINLANVTPAIVDLPNCQQDPSATAGVVVRPSINGPPNWETAPLYLRVRNIRI